MVSFDEPQQRLQLVIVRTAALCRGVSRWFHRRGERLVSFLDMGMETLIVGWIALTVLFALGKIAQASACFSSSCDVLITLLPYLLIAFAPIAGYRVATGAFPHGLLAGQPDVRFCLYGTWKRLNPVAARQSMAFGPAGLMASLILGILLNVPFRSFELLLSLPVIGPGDAGWARGLMAVMTLDVVVMNFFYMVCFVMALRSVPLFPRMLLFAWGMDLSMQFAIAHYAGTAQAMPPAVAHALQAVLLGNIKKVLISALVWLPYLILSERVNITFRQRVRA